MRLIDADALIETIRKHSYLMRGEWNESDYAMTVTGIEQAIAEQPEAVVRCENCIYWDTQDRGTVVAKCNYQSVARYLTYTDADDYCSNGERRTDE